MRQTLEAERARLNETFAALCRIESPSGRERACADHVMRELRALGLEVEEDDAGVAAEADAGNLFTRVSGRRPESVLLCAHLDTVPPLAPIDPVIVDGGWENAGEGILGADNKAAVAVLIELARRFAPGGEVPRDEATREKAPPEEAPGGSAPAGEPPPIGIELLFTVSEENGLRGATAFDAGRLQSTFGYVFDHASPIGGIVVAAPSYDLIVATMRGRAAHAGIRPEEGRSAILAAARAVAAMPLGRLDEHTTANVGVIAGGTATNVVPERCRIEAEVRGIDDTRVAAVVTEIVDHLHDAAGATECDLDVTVQRLFQGYRSKPSAPEIVAGTRALQACGYEPHHLVTGGGSDANALRVAGLPCANLADGTEHNHEPGERVSIDALEGMLEVVIALVDAAAEVLTP